MEKNTKENSSNVVSSSQVEEFLTMTEEDKKNLKEKEMKAEIENFDEDAPIQIEGMDQEEDIDSSLRFKLDQFEGPLDLLYHLIKVAKIDIRDIFISQI